MHTREDSLMALAHLTCRGSYHREDHGESYGWLWLGRHRNWILMQTSSHQTGDVGHVDHQQSADRLGDFLEFGKIDGPWISASTSHD